MSTVKTIQCELETITPVHIGTGREILPSDYLLLGTSTGGAMARAFQALAEDRPAQCLVIYDLHGYVRSLQSRQRDAVLSKIGRGAKFILTDELNTNARDDQHYWASYADITDFVVNEIRRAIRLKRDASVRETIKEPHPGDESVQRLSVYVPGSTIKGSLRTSLGFFLATQNIALLGDRFEKLAFQHQNTGSEEDKLEGAQVDVLRCLEISDSNLRLATSDVTEILAVKTMSFSHGGKAYFKSFTTFREAIKSDQCFTFRMGVKTGLLEHGDALHRLGWQNPTQLLRIGDLPQRCNEFTQQVLQEEMNYLAKVPGASRSASAVTALYSSLSSQIQQWLQSGSNECYLCLGYGTSRFKKTVELAIDRIMAQTGVSPASSARHKHYGGKNFSPTNKNRRLSYGVEGTGFLGKGDVRTPDGLQENIGPVSRVFAMSSATVAQSPLGWVKLTFGEGFEEAKDEIIPIPQMPTEQE